MAQGGGGGSSNGRPYSTLSQNGTHPNSVRRPESGTWQILAMKSAAPMTKWNPPAV
ncbi:unnamed protein product [Staurois parvus]|uniref:Uncharacterized protein n=1 Tax=Staurois parvus TaxID=386267 RepID=A0ABN9HER3_9NEOB|nr:unnamed protein product [Staurois parvus]